MIGIAFDGIAEADWVVAFSGGSRRHVAVKPALCRGLVSILVSTGRDRVTVLLRTPAISVALFRRGVEAVDATAKACRWAVADSQ